MKYKKGNCTEYVGFLVVLTVVIRVITGYLGYNLSHFHGRCFSVNRLPES